MYNSLFEPNWQHTQGSKISDAPEKEFCSFFNAFEIKKDYLKVGTKNPGVVHKIVNKIMCYLEGGHPLEEGHMCLSQSRKVK